jgi:hypothetical protein
MAQKIEICIGTDRDGGVRVRLSLLMLDDQQLISEHYHSMMLMPGDDAAEARRMLEQHLAMSKAASGIPGAPWPRIPDEEWAKVLAVLPVFHTAAAVLRYRQRAERAAQARAAKDS